MKSITRYEGGMKIEINDYLDLIVNSPKITQLFTKAVAHVVTSTVAGVVSEIVVTISSEVNTTKLILHEHKVALRIGKMNSTVRLYANALRDAKSSSYPPEMISELERLLWESFYEELRKARHS